MARQPCTLRFGNFWRMRAAVSGATCRGEKVRELRGGRQSAASVLCGSGSFPQGRFPSLDPGCEADSGRLFHRGKAAASRSPLRAFSHRAVRRCPGSGRMPMLSFRSDLSVSAVAPAAMDPRCVSEPSQGASARRIWEKSKARRSFAIFASLSCGGTSFPQGSRCLGEIVAGVACRRGIAQRPMDGHGLGALPMAG